MKLGTRMAASVRLWLRPATEDEVVARLVARSRGQAAHLARLTAKAEALAAAADEHLSREPAEVRR